MRTSWSFFTSACALAALVLAAIVVASNWTWYQDPSQIESHLLADTPLGSTEEFVLTRLRTNGISPDPIWHGPVPANSAYPESTVAGHGFTHVVVARYRVIFETSVEAFYIFDANQRLIEIAVRKTTDAL